MTNRLFYEDEFDAFAEMIGKSGKTQKECAHFLWPDMKQTSALAKLQQCLDRHGDERLKFGQVVALMTFCGQYDALMYACDETLHARPDRKSAKDQEQRIAEVIANASHMMQRAMQELNNLRSRAA